MPASIGTEELRALVVMARTKDLTQAARELNLMRRSLTQFAHRFERRIGVSLFIWGRQRVELTTHGVVFVDRAKRVLEMLCQAAEQMNVSEEIVQYLSLPPQLPIPESPREARRRIRLSTSR